jgi:hypothetical protein
LQEYVQQQEKIALKHSPQDSIKEISDTQDAHPNVSSPRQQVTASNLMSSFVELL